jgi:hypothetical protein
MMYRVTVVAALVAVSGVAHAEGTVVPYTGVAIGRYRERASGLKFESDLQPFLFAGVEGGIPAGDAAVILGAQAGFGTDVHMDAVYFGDLVQNNRFEQEIYEGTVRYRWKGRGSLIGEVGYRFTMQRLHFSDIKDAQGNTGIADAATEVVTVHAVEGGIGWVVVRPDGTRRSLIINAGLNRGSAENDQIEGEDFSALGVMLRVVATHRWTSGLQVEGILAYRQQNGSDSAEVTVNGMTATAFWPKNVTWMLGGALAYAF